MSTTCAPGDKPARNAGPLHVTDAIVAVAVDLQANRIVEITYSGLLFVLSKGFRGDVAICKLPARSCQTSHRVARIVAAKMPL